MPTELTLGALFMSVCEAWKEVKGKLWHSSQLGLANWAPLGVQQKLLCALSQLAQRNLGAIRNTEFTHPGRFLRLTLAGAGGTILAVTSWIKCTTITLSTYDPLFSQTFPWKGDSKFVTKSGYKPSDSTCNSYEMCSKFSCMKPNHFSYFLSQMLESRGRHNGKQQKGWRCLTGVNCRDELFLNPC